MKVLWDTLQSSTSLPLFLLQFFVPPLSFYSSIEASSLSFLSKTLSWWWSFFFHDLFPSGWRLLSPFLLYLPYNFMDENHHWRTSLRLKDPASIEASQGSFHQSLERKLQWRKRMRETEREKEKEWRGNEGKKERERSWTLKCVSQDSHSSKLPQVLHMLLFIA